MEISVELGAIILLFGSALGFIVKQAQRFSLMETSIEALRNEIDKVSDKLEYIITCYSKHDTELALTKQTINNLDLKVTENQVLEKKNSENINDIKIKIKELSR